MPKSPNLRHIKKFEKHEFLSVTGTLNKVSQEKMLYSDCLANLF